MSDVFISYARSTADQAQAVANALRALGYDVWRDDQLPAHRAYGEVIEERLTAAKAVVVIWSAEAAKSQWVFSEANRAREDGKLVQLTVDGARLPMPFDSIQCVDMAGWSGEAASPSWRKVVASVADLIGGTAAAPAPSLAARKLSICVLPFANMSGDAEQEYFSDGISEDIITDLSKVSALSVTARNNAFTFKGKTVEIQQIARQLGVSHVLEGSVRKSGNRVRITAQLIDGAAGDHLWAERWDRNLDDIFALQDEISQAIVKALKLRLLPEEKTAIERRGTDNVEAYNLYLMARQYLISGTGADVQRLEAIVRLCQAAIEIDPNYARIWALMAVARRGLHFHFGHAGSDALAAAERALALDPNLAEAHAVKGDHFWNIGRPDEARAEIDIALGLDPDSWEVNINAGYLSYRQGRFDDSIRYFGRAASAVEADFVCTGMMTTASLAVGDAEGAREAARMTLERAERGLANDPSNGSAMGFGAGALAALGEGERAKDWIRRALLIDPDNLRMRYNLACALTNMLGDSDSALELLDPFFAKTTASFVDHAKVDPDLDRLRGDPRFQAMLAGAEARLAAASKVADGAKA
ncbi:MAG TPA: TIR domain-containing protein [Caulobacteraceae bacterium]|nr:TIR domain-containing protein [Caulobacteraceae bacterium]